MLRHVFKDMTRIASDLLGWANCGTLKGGNMNFEQVPLEKVKDLIAKGEVSLMGLGDAAPQPLGETRFGPGLQPKEGSTMGREDKELWMRLCEQASVEQDPEKLLTLVKEINRLLEKK
jgi:hypothetical protein